MIQGTTNSSIPNSWEGVLRFSSAFSGVGIFSGGQLVGGTDLDTTNTIDLNPGEILDDELNFYSTALSDSLKKSSRFSILDLRTAEATQRYREITQPNAKDYPSQMNAHFDSNTPDVLGNYCTYLGGMSANININDVTNTALDESSSESTKAWIKGKGTFVNDGKLEFQAKEHGIIMGIYHIVPLLDYDSVGVNPIAVKTSADDFAIPEFDSIGMQPVPITDLSIYIGSSSSETVPNIGYAPRYAEYKTAVDKVHGAFMTTLKDWYSPITSSYIKSVLQGDSGYSLENWYVFKKVCPGVLDTIFGVNADSTPDTDEFLVNMFVDCKAVRPLDRNGLPY